VSRLSLWLERLPDRRGFLIAILALVLLIFATGNLPWHLDNYDQAKQAFVSLEIVKKDAMWFQHTPNGRYASKPPLMGWVSAGLHAAGMPWDFAWRVPSFICALAILTLLMSEGRMRLGTAGAGLAAAAFGLNLLSPRLATLVRTDMMLGCFIFFVGWMIYRKLRSGTPWTPGERWAVFAFMLAALFTKGPVIYAFLLPGLIAFLLIERKNRALAWSGWWTWLVPFALFLAWLGVGLAANRPFYDDVVDHEFFSRFQEGARDDERPQPIWFYFPHLLHKFAPWSVLLLAIVICFPQVRRRLRDRPEIFWLVLWSMGGLLLMTLVPAKRVDRIFPVVPPLCLLVVEWSALMWKDRRMRVAGAVAMLAGMAFAGGYFIGLVPLSYQERTPAIVEFSQRVREAANARGIRKITLPRSRDEGLLLYCDVTEFADKSDAFDSWKAGKPMALVVSERNLKAFRAAVGPATPQFDSGELIRKNEKRYYLFLQN